MTVVYKEINRDADRLCENEYLNDFIKPTCGLEIKVDKRKQTGDQDVDKEHTPELFPGPGITEAWVQCGQPDRHFVLSKVS